MYNFIIPELGVPISCSPFSRSTFQFDMVW